MSAAPLYQLIDFGGGKKLERIGGVIVERPHPGAVDRPFGSPFWQTPDLIFRQQSWIPQNSATEKLLSEKSFASPDSNAWEVKHNGIRLALKPTPAGQVGIFPEHWAHWDWFREKLQADFSSVSATDSITSPQNPPRVLHLFGYTGATTLALAHMGYHVTHVDASKPTVAWARENSTRSQLDHKSIRWVVEDAAKFVAREVKRGNQYDAIILDPPTFGHGTKAERWEIQRDLYPLLENCWRLLSSERRFVLLCGHSADIRLRALTEALRDQFGSKEVGKQSAQTASLQSESGGILDCGYACKFEW